MVGPTEYIIQYTIYYNTIHNVLQYNTQCTTIQYTMYYNTIHNILQYNTQCTTIQYTIYYNTIHNVQHIIQHCEGWVIIIDFESCSRILFHSLTSQIERNGWNWNFPPNQAAKYVD